MGYNWELRRLIVEKFDAQYKFGEAVGLPEPTVSLLIRGHWIPGPDMRAKICDALGCTEDLLVVGDKEFDPSR